MRIILCLLLLFSPSPLWAFQIEDESGAMTLDFLYVNANAGEAAGGHTAFRLGDSVFHYQFFPNSTFLLVREPWPEFRFLYNDLHNRTISLASLPLDPVVYAGIRNHFTELLIAQQQFFAAYEGVQEEEKLVRKMVNGSYEISVPGLGFFTKQGTDTYFCATLKEQIEAELGTDFLPLAVAQADENLKKTLAAIKGGERVGRNLREHLVWRESLRVLAEAWELDETSLVVPMPGEAELGPPGVGCLQGFGEQLARSISELLQSTRPDRGESLLLQTARYLAVQRSLATGQLYTLDPFPDDGRKVWLAEGELGEERLLVLQEDFLCQAVKYRTLFFKEELYPQIAYSFLEASRGRAWELLQAGDGQQEVRILAQGILPSRKRMVSFATLEIEKEMLHAISQALVEELNVMADTSEELYGYNLFRRNCATELIRSLNSTFSDARAGEAALGGWLEPDDGLVFVPFLFYERSCATFFLQDKQTLTARRLRNLEKLYEVEGDLLVWLRESNTLTATLYESRSKDTPFLFFTDDALLLRPLQGVLNVGYAALHGAAGLVTFPFDGGDRLHQAARGIFYSLPELAFGNIRKGSYSTAESKRNQ
jgi:hypothetical protein